MRPSLPAGGRHLIVRAAALAAVTAATLATSASGAFADSTHWISINTGSGWVHDSSTPLFDTTHIAPGWSDSHMLQVRNDAADPGTLALSATDIVEAENGCMHSEALVDATCGAADGELGHELVFSAYLDPENDGTFESMPRWTGSLYDLATPAVLDSDLGGHGVVGLRIDAALPMTSGNETQTDQVTFNFRLSLEGSGSPSSVTVLGTKHTRHAAGGVAHLADQLPFTGSPAERFVAAALWLIIGGTGLALLARSRPGRSRVK